MNATASSESSCVISDDNTELRVKGRTIDELCESLAFTKQEDNEDPIDFCKSTCLIHDRLGTYNATGESITAVLGITLSSDKKKYDPDVIRDCEQDFREFYSVIMSGKVTADIEKDVSSASNSVIELLASSYSYFVALGISRKNYVGLVPRETRIGDKVVLLSGGRLPFILRPVGDHFQLIGGCYMHGYMKGEAWPEDEEALQEIIIR